MTIIEYAWIINSFIVSLSIISLSSLPKFVLKSFFMKFYTYTRSQNSNALSQLQFCPASQASLTTYNIWTMPWTWQTFSLPHLVDEVRYLISFQQIVARPDVSLIQSVWLLTFLVSIFQTCLWLPLTFSINKSIRCLFRSLFPCVFLLFSTGI